jgi:TatD DNase family protein
MEIKYIDIHSHFNLKQFEGDLDEAVKKMHERGVATICVGTDLATSKRAVEIAEKYDFIWATVGQHPTDTQDNFKIEDFEELARHPKVVAIGECGLDYFRSPKDEVYEHQRHNFLAQIELAKLVRKPLMIHARPTKDTMNAYEDVLDILQDHDEIKANFHFFVGNKAIAQRALDQGHTMSFDGPITFTEEYNEVLKVIPLESIMAETDSPYAAPEPHRGGRAEPWMVEFIYKKIAQIRGEDEEEVRQALNENASKFFNILF